MSGLPDKAAVRAALREALAAALDAMSRSAEEARLGAVHEEARQEGAKDMRATEQSYVARGQAMRAEALAEELERFERSEARAFGPDDPIAAGALVRVEVDEAPRVLFVGPWGGGTELRVDGAEVTVISPSSPLGRALLGKRVGDDLELRLHGAVREIVVDAVA